jgi:hypothetical protein
MQLPKLELALMSLQLTFGGASGPYEWSVISETICNLTTAIKHNKKMEPKDAGQKKSTSCPPSKILG